jgi:hypothetical protein
MLALFKGPYYIVISVKRVDSLAERGRLYLYLIMSTLFKRPSYILGGGERVNNFIKGGRLC